MSPPARVLQRHTGSLLATAAAEAWYTSGDVVDSVIADRWAKAAAVSETR
ncbi:MAG: hypothetical protein ACRDS0_00370 [Pseudonocardiaceae bacterium]